MKIFILLCLQVFMVQLGASPEAFSASTSEKSPADCLAQVNFKISAMYSWSEQVFLEKKACVLTYHFEHGGKVERWRFDVCSSRITLEYFPSSETKNPEIINIGSFHCSKPLFDVDDDVTPKDLDRFPRERAQLRELMKRVRKDKLLRPMTAQINCFEKLEERYLDECAVSAKTSSPAQ